MTRPPTIDLPAILAARRKARERREVEKRTKGQFRCGCGAVVFEIRVHALRAEPKTTVALVRQAHRRHQREAGCGKELA